MYTTTIDTTADIIDTRDIIAHIEELENERDDYTAPNRDGYNTMIGADWAGDNPDESQELATLTAIMDDLKGNGGDEQWRGDWYPVTLIRDSHFIDYAQELAEDCGMIPADAQWPNNCIDWIQAARELRMDYSCAEINQVSYWYR